MTRMVLLIDAQTTEETHAAAFPIRSLRSRPLPRCRFIRGLNMEIRLGQARSRDPWNHTVKHWLTVSIPVAIAAL